MNDRLGADLEAAHRRDLAAAVAALEAAGDRLAGATTIEIADVRDALAAIDRLSLRLKARGGRAARTEAEKALEATERLIASPIAPRLIRLLLDHTPVPGGPPTRTDAPSLIEVAEFYNLATAWMARRDPRHPIVADLKRGLAPFVVQARAYVETAESRMAGPDHPDLGEIAAIVLRLDVLTWILVTAGFVREAGEVQARTRRLARSAMRRATAVIDRCAATFSLDDRVNLAGAISEIDDLVLIFQRVREGEREEVAAGGETFGQSIGAKVIGDFSEALIRLSRGIMELFVLNGLDAAVPHQHEIVGMLRALSKLYRLVVAIGDDSATTALGRTAQEIRAGVLTLAVHLDRAITQAREARDKIRLTRLESVRQTFIAFAESLVA